MRLIAGVLLLTIIGCATFPGKIVGTYTWEPSAESKLNGEAGKIENLRFLDNGFAFKFVNTTDKTAKIVWDETVIVMPDGSAKKVLPIGVRYIDATRSIPSAIIPGGASLDTEVARADAVRYETGIATHHGIVGGGWQTESVIPCGSNYKVWREKCDPAAHYGKPLSLILAVEHNGKKIEYKATGKISKSPSFASWQEEHAPKSQVAEK